jgi:hypothetical protein
VVLLLVGTYLVVGERELRGGGALWVLRQDGRVRPGDVLWLTLIVAFLGPS